MAPSVSLSSSSSTVLSAMTAGNRFSEVSCRRNINASTLCISQFCPLRSGASNVAAHRTCIVPSTMPRNVCEGNYASLKAGDEYDIKF